DGCGRAWFVEPGDGFAAGVLHHRMIAQQVAGPQCRKSGLPRPEEIARAALFEVALGDDETIGGLHQRVETRPARVADWVLVKEHARRRTAAPPDAAAQLVQLRESESLGMLD